MVQRDVIGYTVKHFMPLLFVAVALLFGYAVPIDQPGVRASIAVTSWLIASVLYQKLSSDLPTVSYLIVMDYMFFAFFGICLYLLLVTVATDWLQRQARPRAAQLVNRTGSSLILVSLVTMLVLVWHRYGAII
jgi:hypothetical protein